MQIYRHAGRHNACLNSFLCKLTLTLLDVFILTIVWDPSFSQLSWTHFRLWNVSVTSLVSFPDHIDQYCTAYKCTRQHKNNTRQCYAYATILRTSLPFNACCFTRVLLSMQTEEYINWRTKLVDWLLLSELPSIGFIEQSTLPYPRSKLQSPQRHLPDFHFQTIPDQLVYS